MSQQTGRVMPAEWSAHQATWITWPRNADTWPGVLAAARSAMADLVTALAPQEHVHINVFDADEARQVEQQLAGRVPPEQISLERIETNDAWIRDYGALIVRDRNNAKGSVAVDFDYNAWGGKYPPYDRDQRVARSMAERLQLDCVTVPIVLEGGSVDVNGQGVGLVTEQCLLNPNRNPSLSRAEIEVTLSEFLGIEQAVWLGHGVVGDDTDGHIDNLARFVAPDCVVVAVEPSRADPNHKPLADNMARLREFRDDLGRSLEIVELPLPPPIIHDGGRLPASYANFYIANDLVVVPAYAESADQIAVGILADCFPGRAIVPVDCRALIVGLGALHCLTQQIPVIVADPAA